MTDQTILKANQENNSFETASFFPVLASTTSFETSILVSHVAIKTEVIDATHLLFGFYFCHYYECILFFLPLLAQ